MGDKDGKLIFRVFVVYFSAIFCFGSIFYFWDGWGVGILWVYCGYR